MWDEGIGIDQTDFKKLFKSFNQLETPLTKKYQGTGLGLYICKNIVELHGGQIWVESVKGEGTQFIFSIPYSNPITELSQNAEEFMDKIWSN